MNFARRTWINSLLLLGISCLTGGIWLLSKIGLVATERYTGFALLAVVVLLALFNARKKLPFLPVFSVSGWLQWHIYMGLFSMLLFLLHIGFKLPSGVFEYVLAAVFITVAFSGIGGLFLSRYLPRKMNQSGEAITYKQIPRFRVEIREKIEDLVFEAEDVCQSSTLSEFYTEYLHEYLGSRPSFFHAFVRVKKSRAYVILNELSATMLYLSDDEKVIAEQIREWIETKENLDFQEAAQRLLKGWLFVHIPLSGALLLLGGVHGVFVLLYGGGA